MRRLLGMGVAVILGLSTGTIAGAAVGGAAVAQGAYFVEVAGIEFGMCAEGDTLSSGADMADANAKGEPSAQAAAESHAAMTREGAQYLSSFQSLRDFMAPGLVFEYDTTSSLKHDNLTFFDRVRQSEDAEILTARVVVEETANGFYVAESFTCTSELTTDYDQYRAAAQDVFGDVISEPGGNDEG